MKTLRRFWFTFSPRPQYSPLALGCGVTAFDRTDAIEILHRLVFAGRPAPLVVDEVIEDVDVLQLDPGHVIPNMGLVTTRGVWFPLGYEQVDDPDVGIPTA